MVTNPFKERYRELIHGPLLDAVTYSDRKGALMIELYYALEEALGRIYELEQTLEGRERYSEEGYD